MARNKKNTSIMWAVLVAVMLGLTIAVAIYNPLEEPPPPPPEIEHADEYNDDWGKLDTPATQADVRHILISWKGKNARVTPKDPERTEKEARELVEELWHKYRNNPTVETWDELAKEHTEDSGAYTQVYTCKTPNPGLDGPFNDTGLLTKPGHARIASGSFGFHLIRREK